MKIRVHTYQKSESIKDKTDIIEVNPYTSFYTHFFISFVVLLSYFGWSMSYWKVWWYIEATIMFTIIYTYLYRDYKKNTSPKKTWKDKNISLKLWQELWEVRIKDKNFLNHHNYYQHKNLEIISQKKLFLNYLRKTPMIATWLLCFLGIVSINNFIYIAVAITIFYIWYWLLYSKIKSNVLSQKINAKNMYDPKDYYLFFY